MAHSALLRRLYESLFGIAGRDDGLDADALLRRRVIFYLQFQTVLLGVFLVLDTASGILERGGASLTALPELLHIGAFLWFFCGAWFARRRSLAAGQLRALEVFSTLALLGFVALTLRALPADLPALGPAFAVAVTLVVRAAVVPGSGTWALVVGGIATTGVAWGYFGRGDEATGEVVTVWMLAFSLTSTFVSRTIYGLQRQVFEARRLGHYVLGRKLGEGGMGAVYRARHVLLKRPTAVKLLLPAKTGEANLVRFEREVQQTARLSHPNTVTIYDYGRTPGGVFYYAMELLDGADLDDVVAVDGPQCPARVVHVLERVAEALHEAHSIGLIHRDVKPDNIVLCRRGGVDDVPKVVDFGLVKQAGTEVEVTSPDVLIGTPLFMSPEAISGVSEVDARSDLYALGAVAYFLLTGHHVFQGSTIVDICGKHLTAQPVAPSQRTQQSLPAALEQLVLACLAKDPRDRPQTAHEFAQRLRGIGVDPWTPEQARQWWQEHQSKLDARRAIDPLDSVAESPECGRQTMAVALDQRS